jgi:UDP-3-O-[3-hydroxymyristoyl] glucosamine N-acyltransferase
VKLSELIQEFGGQVDRPFADLTITGVATLDAAGPEEVSFFTQPRYREQLAGTRAAAVLVRSFAKSPVPQILVAEPQAVVASLLERFHPEPAPPVGIHPTAVLGARCSLAEGVAIGPFCVLEDDVSLGPGTWLRSHVHLGAGCQLGAGCCIFPQVTLYPGCRLGDRVRVHSGSVLGSDGYGYVFQQGIHRKIPQVGWLEIGDDVEIGSNVSIDRGALRPTRLGKGCKIDNLVQIAHGVELGEHCLVVSQCGIAGSTSLGDYVVLAGQVGVNGHLRIGSQVTVLGKSVVTKNLPEAGRYAGNPAVPHLSYQKQLASLRALAKIGRGNPSKGHEEDEGS